MTFRFVDDKGLHSAEEVSEEISILATSLGPGTSVIVIESERSLRTALRFSACLMAGRIPFMLPSEEFRKGEFLKYAQETLGRVSSWPISSELPLSAGGVIHPEVARVNRGFIVKTSGTSGMKNKFVLHDSDLFLQKFRKRKPSFDKTINFFPPDSIAGIELLLEASIHEKCILNPGENLEPAHILRIITQEKPDFLHVTPTFLNLLLVNGLTKEHLASVSCLAYGSEPAQKTVLEKVRALNPQMELRQIYGMSEVGLLKTLSVTSTPEMFRLDQQVNPYRITEGFLDVKSESPMVCYLNSDRMVENGWFSTGDVVEVSQALLRVVGRADDVINVAGKKFHPIQLEELLMGMSDINDVMITSEPHELIGSAVLAHISTRSPEKEFRAAFREYLEKNVPSWMRPQKVVLNPAAMSSRLKKRRKSSV